LHGFGASAIWQWTSQARALVRTHRVIMPDLLFFGGSSSQSPDRTPSFQAEAMGQLLDHFSVEKAHVMGISYGGFIAGLLAGNTPERVDKLIIVDCPLTMMGHEDLDALLKRFDVKTLQELMLPKTPDGIRRLLKIAWRRPPKVPNWILRDVHRTLYCNQVEEKAALLDAVVAKIDEPTISLDTIQSETLIIWGEHDAIFPLSLAHQLQKALPTRPELKVIAKAAHAPIVEKARAFNRLVLKFLNK